MKVNNEKAIDVNNDLKLNVDVQQYDTPAAVESDMFQTAV